MAKSTPHARTLFNLWTLSTATAELAESAHLVNRMSELAVRTGSDELALMSHCARVRTVFFRAELAESADSVRQVLTLYDPLRYGDLPNRYSQDDPAVISLGVDAWRLWLQGYPAQAAARAREACFRSALEIARRQQARSLELRAALSLSRLWSRNRSDDARRLLGGVLETFSEGHDTADLRQASEQMARLARTG